MKRYLEIEITTRCPIKCPACPRTYQTDWDTGYLDEKLVFKTFDDDYYNTIRLCGCYGDCLYHPDFVEIARHASTITNKNIGFETNGSYRRPEFWQELSEIEWKQKHEFIFSIDGLEDTNHIYRKNSDWESIMYGVNTLAGAKSKPKLSWQMLVFPYNQHQVETAKALSKKLGFDNFSASKSLRKYKSKWFENDDERRLIDWNFS